MNIDSTAQIVGGYGSAQAPAATVLGGSQGVQGSLSCSTAGGVPIQDRQQLVSHLQSDLHKYNLKRKIANLPPVTKEWFEARKAQLASMQAQGAQAAVPPGCVRLWVCPLTKKVFKTEHTYQAHTRSRKYQDVLKKAGLEQPPAPIISHKTIADTAEKQQQQQQQQRQQGAPGFKVVMPSGGLPLKKEDASPAQAGQQGKAEKEDGSGEDDDDDGASGWETASDNEEDDVVGPLPHGQPAPPEGSEAAEDWEEWDVKRSLFDNHVSKSFEANLEYMWKNFGFYLPDAQYLKDPEGLIKYLGAKIQYGRVPIYTRGDDSNAKQFRSLHAVQRHMVDSGRCKMAYEDNEDEYSDFYEYEGEDESSQGEAAASTSRELIASGNKDVPAAELVSGGYELYLPSSSGQGHGGGKIIGSRDLARYYRQNPRPVDERRSVQVNTMLAKYRSLGIALKDEARSMEAKKAKSKSNKTFKYEARHVQGIYMRSNVIKNLPSCVPY
mmetsp:Transcript_11229/g.30624  ORF Transcript_11229/g.30624 Transcript_11229/m.30624 type:complete len:495 (-) Transcript_11229:426-1910(-)|eukprot:CAMPEP_0202378938 /NCGR_PEP_ID=MMETSP1127-20130417/21529_1 /ASSEMBLY_ACC=CAM_ASM_000462 /TAXON_ID=3047 /ORGANISM="Dunaliella tertiolecta, Strain CCMP1320" /LENGTH=494 /DNA_ID=CAMNT_0048977351 /DNA_START=35 /DNA_END=1519 /DNA_ORIENTATION=-